jgi:hypothetical protein
MTSLYLDSLASLSIGIWISFKTSSIGYQLSHMSWPSIPRPSISWPSISWRPTIFTNPLENSNQQSIEMSDLKSVGANTDISSRSRSFPETLGLWREDVRGFFRGYRSICSVSDGSSGSRQSSRSLALEASVSYYISPQPEGDDGEYHIGMAPVLVAHDAVNPVKGKAVDPTDFSLERLQHVFRPNLRLSPGETEEECLAKVEAMARKYKRILEDPSNPCPNVRAAVLDNANPGVTLCPYGELQREWDAYNLPDDEEVQLKSGS